MLLQKRPIYQLLTFLVDVGIVSALLDFSNLAACPGRFSPIKKLTIIQKLQTLSKRYFMGHWNMPFRHFLHFCFYKSCSYLSYTMGKTQKNSPRIRETPCIAVVDK